MLEKEIKKDEKEVVKNEVGVDRNEIIREPVKKSELGKKNRAPKVEKTKTQQGVVTRCNLLNVRKEPVANAEILRIIARRDKLTIIKNESKTGVFYKIKLDDGLEGFVMKEFIDIVK